MVALCRSQPLDAMAKAIGMGRKEIREKRVEEAWWPLFTLLNVENCRC